MKDNHGVAVTLFGLTTFLTAFLLFQIQPILGALLLPRLGGGAGVWTVCMLFFQLALLAGYLYAHLLERLLSLPRQVVVHLFLLGLSLAGQPMLSDAAHVPASPDSPEVAILLVLAKSIGGPFVLLAASSPLFAAWYRRGRPSGAPYRLYAVSNAGSLLALLSYPFVFEHFLTLHVQGTLWSALYLLFVLGTLACAWFLIRTTKAGTPTPAARPAGNEPGEAPRWPAALAWVALSATGVVFLLATTRWISEDLSVVPMLWILPLSFYLLSFILCFERDTWYVRRLFLPLLAVGVGAVVHLLFRQDAVDARIQVAVLVGALFVFCMVCHGELSRLRPARDHLTGFYLALALGGALGGVLTVLVAPLVFSGFFEYHVALMVLVPGVLVAVLRDLHGQGRASRRLGRRLALAGGVGALVMTGLAVALTAHALSWQEEAIATSRSFFGTLRVKVKQELMGEMRDLLHGETSHGAQFQVPDLRSVATTYYGRHSGVGLAISAYRSLLEIADPLGGEPGGGLRIGCIGLGAGTVAALAQQGDSLRFYEIDPQVAGAARDYFSFLADTQARVEVVLGDARILLERELATTGPQGFDLLLVDAFNGDAVPRHLLTLEAYALYRHHLRPGGVIAFHTSNRNLALSSIVASIARHHGDQAVRIQSVEEEWLGTVSARWVLTTRNPRFLALEQLTVEATPWSPEERVARAWSDERASLWEAIRLRDVRRPNRWRRALNKGRFVVDTGRFLSPTDDAAIRARTRALYLASGGRFPLLVLTVGEDPQGTARYVEFERFVGLLADRVGFDWAGPHQGVMILVSLPHGRVGARIGKQWAGAAKQRLMTALSPLAVRVERDEISAMLGSTIAALDRISREDASLPPTGLAGRGQDLLATVP